jgi:hypothetical protein
MALTYTRSMTTVALSNSSNLNGSDLQAGFYWVYADAAFSFKKGGSGVTAATTDRKREAYPEKTLVEVTCAGDARIAGIVASGTATMYIEPVE